MPQGELVRRILGTLQCVSCVFKILAPLEAWMPWLLSSAFQQLTFIFCPAFIVVFSGGFI